MKEKKSTQRVREWRENNKIQASYLILKAHAKERGIEFSLSKEYWGKFCEETEYHLLKGIGKNDLTVDRKDPRMGYVEGNIQILTMKQNRRKGFTDMKLLKESVEKDNDCPF